MTQIGNIVQVKTSAQIQDDILAELAALLGISDNELVAWIRIFTGAFSEELGAFYYQLWRGMRANYIRTAKGYALNLRAQDYSLIREPAIKATGYVTFVGTNGTVITPGVIVAKPATDITDQVRFVVKVGGTIPVSGSLELAIEAEVAGEIGNVGDGEITELVSSIPGVTSITNAAGTRLGREEEDDETLRERILRTIAGLSRGTVPAIRAGAVDFRVQELTLAGSIDAIATEIPVDQDLNLLPVPTAGTIWVGSEPIFYTNLSLSSQPHKFTGLVRPTPTSHLDATRIKEYIPAGRGERVVSVLIEEDFLNGHVDVTIDDGTEQGASAELVALVQGRLRGDGTDRNPGYRGAGITLDVHAAGLSSIAISIEIAVKTGYSVDATKKQVADRVVREINGLGVNNVAYAYVIAEIAQATEGVETLKALVVDGTTFVGTNTADVTPPSRGVIRTTGALVTVTA